LIETHPASADAVVFATSGGCPPLPGVRELHHAHCEGLLERAKRFADRDDVKTVVLGANWVGYFIEPDPDYRYYIPGPNGPESILFGSQGADRALEGLGALIASFRRADRNVYLLLQTPWGPSLDPRSFIKTRMGPNAFRIDAPPVSRTSLLASVGSLEARLREIAESAGAKVIDPLDYLCSDVCDVISADGIPLYRDQGHLNPAFVRSHVNFLDKLIQQDAAP
jgi:hypothetical protein